MKLVVLALCILACSLKGAGLEGARQPTKSCVEALSAVFPNHLAFLDAWRAAGYRIDYQKGAGGPIRAVVIGEAHYSAELVQKQLEIIAALEPEWVLHEFAGYRMYDPSSESWEALPGRSFSRTDQNLGGEPPEAIMELSRTMLFKIIGNDLSDAEICDVGRRLAKEHPQKYKWSNKFKVLVDRKDANRFITNQSKEIVPFRDAHMAKMTIEYASKATKPIVVVLGSNHSNRVREQRLIEASGIGCVFIDQTAGM
jgi:hypothetical protein